MLTATARSPMIVATTRSAVWQGGSTIEAFWAPSQTCDRSRKRTREAMVAQDPAVAHPGRRPGALAAEQSYPSHHWVAKRRTAAEGKRAASQRKPRRCATGLVSVMAQRELGATHYTAHTIRRPRSQATCNAGSLHAVQWDECSPIKWQAARDFSRSGTEPCRR
jgi:hypothetical protein